MYEHASNRARHAGMVKLATPSNGSAIPGWTDMA
jgi:hypothetical protein